MVDFLENMSLADTERIIYKSDYCAILENSVTGKDGKKAYWYPVIWKNGWNKFYTKGQAFKAAINERARA